MQQTKRTTSLYHERCVCVCVCVCGIIIFRTYLFSVSTPMQTLFSPQCRVISGTNLTCHVSALNTNIRDLFFAFYDLTSPSVYGLI